MRWVLRETVYKKASGLLSTLAAVGICAERAASFAESQTGGTGAPGAAYAAPAATPGSTPQASQSASAPLPNAPAVTAAKTAEPIAAATAAPSSGVSSLSGRVVHEDGPGVEGEERIDIGAPGANPSNSADPDPDATPLKESAVPLSERHLEKFARVQTKQQACELLEGKILTYYDVASLVRGCKQQVVEDAELLNELVHLKRRKVIEVPARIYRLIPFGRPLSKTDLDGHGNSGKRLSKEECAEIEKRYVTVSGMNYYFIEDCKRRAFDSYYALQEHNVGKTTIVTLSPETLYRIAEGPDMKVKGVDEESMLMRMDGDVKWSRLARANREGHLPNDTPASLKAIQNSGKVDRDAVCRKFNGKVVSFYSQVYYLEDCRRRGIEGFSLTLQQRLQAGGGIIDITPEEFKAIPAGKAISEDDVLKLLR